MPSNEVAGFHLYPFASSTVLRLLKRSREAIPELRKAKLEEPVDAIRALYRQSGSDFLKTLDFTVMADEMFWARSGATAIFPSSLHALEDVTAGKFDVSVATGITMPHESFLLAVPRGLELAGRNIDFGILVTWHRHADRPLRVFQPLFNAIGATSAQVKVGDDDVGIADEHTLHISYPVFHDNGDIAFIRSTIPQSLMPAVLRAETGAEFREALGAYAAVRAAHHFPLDERDFELQFLVFRMVVALGVYASAFPDSLRPGFPGAEPKFLGPKGLPKIKSVSLRPAHEAHAGGPRAPGFRRWHIRQLVDERYYRGEHAALPRGSRWVPVREAVVGVKVEAETFEPRD